MRRTRQEPKIVRRPSFVEGLPFWEASEIAELKRALAFRLSVTSDAGRTILKKRIEMFLDPRRRAYSMLRRGAITGMDVWTCCAAAACLMSEGSKSHAYLRRHRVVERYLMAQVGLRMSRHANFDSLVDLCDSASCYFAKFGLMPHVTVGRQMWRGRETKCVMLHLRAGGDPRRPWVVAIFRAAGAHEVVMEGAVSPEFTGVDRFCVLKAREVCPVLSKLLAVITGLGHKV